MAVAEVTHLTIEKGTDFEYDFQLCDENGEFINLENCQVIAKIKKYPRSKSFNTFDVSFLNRSQGIIRLLMSDSSTIFLSEGRNWFDVAVIYPNTKVKLVIKGTIIVEETAISLITYQKTIGDLKKVDTSTADDGEVLMFDQEKQELEFVNPDEVLDKAAEGGLPEEFVDEVKDSIGNSLPINVDFGDY
jgi:hypothetical protein